LVFEAALFTLAGTRAAAGRDLKIKRVENLLG
jgi:hypothetical protein